MPVTIRICWSAAGKTGGQTDETWSWQQIKAKKKYQKKMRQRNTSETMMMICIQQAGDSQSSVVYQKAWWHAVNKFFCQLIYIGWWYFLSFFLSKRRRRIKQPYYAWDTRSYLTIFICRVRGKEWNCRASHSTNWLLTLYRWVILRSRNHRIPSPTVCCCSIGISICSIFQGLRQSNIK